MPDELLHYYERELTFLRQMGAEFAEKYPKVAGRLLLEPTRSEDPHVERLMQAFAFLTARVQHKIDDEFPEVTDALLHVLYPHYLAPIPSMSVVQFVPDPQRGKLTNGYTVERDTVLYSQPVHGTPCRFRTCYPVTLWPIEVAAARLETPGGGLGATGPTAVALLRLELRCLGGASLHELGLEHVRFFLHGESSLTSTLYELLLHNVCQVLLRPLNAPQGVPPLVCPAGCIRPVGFGRDEGMLPYSPRSFLGYRLLQEYFAFPEKFLFIDLGGLDRAVQAGFRDGVEVLIMLDRRPRLEQPLSAETFRLGCAPIVNLFEHIAEPIRVTHTQTEYRVVPDTRQQQATEVYAVDTVTNASPYFEASIAVQPFYALRHGADWDEQPAFWYARRRPSLCKGDAGTEVYLTLVNRDFQPALPAVETLTVHATCTNRDLPGKLPFDGASGDFELEGVAPLVRIRCLKKPTDHPYPTPLVRLRRRSRLWTLPPSRGREESRACKQCPGHAGSAGGAGLGSTGEVHAAPRAAIVRSIYTVSSGRQRLPTIAPTDTLFRRAGAGLCGATRAQGRRGAAVPVGCPGPAGTTAGVVNLA
jgi:type VI secretion system protein ImpG